MNMEVTNGYTDYAARRRAERTQAGGRPSGTANEPEMSAKATGNDSSVSLHERVSQGKGVKVSDNTEYLNKLQKQLSCMKLRVGAGFATAKEKIEHVITISPALLEKMKSDPKVEQEYMQRLKDIERASKYAQGFFKAQGTVTVHNDQWYIDENGKHSHFGHVEIRNPYAEKAAKKAQEDRKKYMEKARENARERSKKLKEQLAEKAEAARERRDEIEELLYEKWSSSEDGSFYLYHTDVQTLIDAAAENDAAREDSDNKSMSLTTGSNVDMRV